MTWVLEYLLGYVREFTDREMAEGWWYVTERVAVWCEEGEFALPLHTDDLRRTCIVATGYDYDERAWEEVFNDGVR